MFLIFNQSDDEKPVELKRLLAFKLPAPALNGYRIKQRFTVMVCNSGRHGGPLLCGAFDLGARNICAAAIKMLTDT